MTGPTAAVGSVAIAARIAAIRYRFEPAGQPAPHGQPAGTTFAELLRSASDAQGGSWQGAAAGPAGALADAAFPTAATGAIALPGADPGQAAVEAATRYLGVPYLWGGTDPTVGLDCSGLLQNVYRGLGVDLPRVSRDQARAGVPVGSLADARPGDLIAFGTPVDHIGIYVGDGRILHAPRTGDVVKVSPIHRTPTAIRRVVGTGPAATPAPAVPAPAVPALAAQTAPGPLSDPSVARYSGLFAAAGARHGIDPSVLAAVAKVESGGNPNAVSPAGARGLMQFMPATARSFGIDPMDPAQAIDGAARYLTQQLRAFGSLQLALAAYNAGPGAVRRHGGIPPFRETQQYVRKVVALVGGAR
jgi:peptidoglycan DL-endopeptidase CwlO